MSLAGSWRLCRPSAVAKRTRLGHPVKVVRVGEFEMIAGAALLTAALTNSFNCVAFFKIACQLYPV